MEREAHIKRKRWDSLNHLPTLTFTFTFTIPFQAYAVCTTQLIHDLATVFRDVSPPTVSYPHRRRASARSGRDKHAGLLYRCTERVSDMRKGKGKGGWNCATDGTRT
jgi:hypothetical protein